MAVELKVPPLGESITEAVVGKWNKKPGDAVSAGYESGVLTVRVAGAHKGAEAQRIEIESR